MPWTNISKPTGTPYTNTNAAKLTYDEPSLSYDDSGTFYDGMNQAAYTNIAKPTGTSYTKITKPT